MLWFIYITYLFILFYLFYFVYLRVFFLRVASNSIPMLHEHMYYFLMMMAYLLVLCHNEVRLVCVACGHKASLKELGPMCEGECDHECFMYSMGKWQQNRKESSSTQNSRIN